MPGVTAGHPGLHIVRSASLASLADDLAGRLADAPPWDPFIAVEVAVPSRGVERWLTQRLSTQLGATPSEAGVCANLRFPFLGGVVDRLLVATLGGPTAAPDPWAPERLAWPLLGVLDELSSAPVYEPLHLHLSEDGAPAPRRRFPLARRIADLFDRYALYRPDMVAAWRAGHDVDGDGAALPSNLVWQPRLWRELSSMLEVPSPDVRTSDGIRRLERGQVERTDDLPGSVTVFGVLGVPPRHLELLAALARHVPVTLYTLATCPAWPAAMASPRPRNPLLVASGGVAREAHTVLAQHADRVAPLPASKAAATTALEVLQDDVRHDHRRGRDPDVPARIWRDGDDSIQVHACHGPLRQLEVLREVLLGLLEDDPTLEPRDIVVVTPDVEAYAPIVPAAFPQRQSEVTGSPQDGPTDLPVRVADQAGRDQDASTALLGLLELVTARVTASQVLDVLAAPPMRASFALSESDLDELQRWLLDTGVAWGIDADHRRELIEVADDAHTWAAALDRWVLGAAMADDGTRLVGAVRPYDDVEGGGVDLLGRVTAATEAVFGALRALRRSRPIGEWVAALHDAVTQLLDPGPGQARDADLTAALANLRGDLDELRSDATAAQGRGGSVPISLEELRGLLADRLAAGRRSVATGTGAITFTGLQPLRNVPHRVVCLVGMDDGAVPRTVARHGFDLLESPSRPGDPDPRAEERQLLLDAVLSATDHLVVTYSGYDPRTNEPLQPAVPVSELLDVLGEAYGAPVPVVHPHPLQPHSARYFRAAVAGEVPVLHAFDPHHLAAARAAAGATGLAPGFLATPLPAAGAELAAPEVIELDELVRFLEHPIRFLLQRRLGLSLGEDDQRLADRDPIALGPLQRWQLGQELLTLRLAGTDPGPWRELTMAAGTVPVGGLGEVALAGVEELVDQVVSEVDGIAGEPWRQPIDLAVPTSGVAGTDLHAVRLTGSVELVGSTVLHVGVSRLKAKHRLAAWVRTVAVLAVAPDPATRAVLIGAGRTSGSGVKPIALDPVQGLAGPHEATAGPPERGPAEGIAELARDHLAALVALYLRGHREVAALLPETGAAYAEARAAGAEHPAALAVAERAWTGSGPFGGDRDDPYVVQAFGRDSDLAAIDARHPFGVAADLLWRPILAAKATS